MKRGASDDWMPLFSARETACYQCFFNGMLCTFEMLSHLSQPLAIILFSTKTRGVNFFHGTLSFPNFSLFGVKYSTSIFLPPMRYRSRQYTFGNESLPLPGLIFVARTLTTESRVMPVSS